MSVNLGIIDNRKSYKPYMAFFIVAAIAVIGFVIHTTTSKATITLIPEKDTTTTSLDVTISAAAKENDISFNIIKGRIIEKEVQKTYTYNETEKKEIDNFAKGTITLINNRSEEQPLLKNTQLRAENGIIFTTDTRVVVPANGSVQVNITATEKGTKGNVEPGKFTVVKLWVNWQDLIYGESKQTLTGGKVNDFVITNKTLENAKKAAETRLKEDIATEIRNELESSENTTAESINLTEIEFSPTVKDGDIAKSFESTIKTKTQIVIYNTASMQKIAEEKMKKHIAESKEVLNLNTENLTITTKNVDSTKQTATLQTSITADTINKIPRQAFNKEELKGRNYQDLIAYYKQYPEVGKIEIDFSPFWVSKTPTNDGNIEILVK